MSSTIRIRATVAAVAALGVVALALSMFPPLLVLGGIVGLTVTAIVFRWPIAGILLIAATLPLERIGTYELQGFTIRISQVLLGITIVSAGIRATFDPVRPRLRATYSSILVVFILICILSLLQSPNVQRSVVILVFTMFTLLQVWVLPRTLTSTAALRRVVVVLLWAALGVSVFGMFQFFGDIIGLPTTVTGLRDLYTKDVLGFPRIQSTAYEPLYFANYLMFPLLIGLSLVLARSHKVSTLLPITLLVVGGSSFVLTVSRGAYLGLAVALIALSFFYFRRIFTLRTLITIPLVVIVVWWIVVKTLGFGGDLFTFDKFQEHVVGVFFGASYTERIDTFDTAVQAWREHPATGVGIGGFGPYAAPHPAVEPKDGWKIVNNQYLELLAETGIMGLSVFILFIAFVCIKSVAAIRTTRDEFLRAVMIGGLAGLIGMMVQYLTFSTLYIMHVWFFIGLMLATQRIAMMTDRP